MKLVINGRERVVDTPTQVVTLSHILRAVLGGPGRGVAVALGDQVVPRGSWDEVEVSEGAKIEIIGAVQGG